jgi:hypothetical protein
MRKPFFCDTTLCQWVISSGCFEEPSAFETSGTVTSVTWLHIPEDRYPQPQTTENFIIRSYLTTRINDCTELLLILKAASIVMQTNVLAVLRTLYSTEVTE